MGGKYGTNMPLPVVPGLEGAGVVVECGQGVEELMGKRVHMSGGGMWAEYKLAKAEEVVQLKEDVTFDQAATLWVNPMTVMMFKELITIGSHTAVVQNAANSALGKMLIRLCRQEGLPLINIVRSAKSAEAIRAEGADNVLDSSDANFLTDYKAACARLNATIAFDAVAGDMTGTVLSGLCPGGVVYVYGGLSEQPSNGIQASDIIFLGKRVEGLALNFWLSRNDKQAICHEIQLSISTIFWTDFAGHYPMSQIQTALTSYKANLSAGKVLIHPINPS
jgi:NADPH:quinone reductase-like Zn-dependent oxidoreductase